MLKIIEFVCTANEGRSPVAELIARNYLGKIGAFGEYAAASSGTAIDDIQNDRVSTAAMISIIELGKQKGLYSADELREIEKAVKDGNDEILKPHFWKAADKFQETTASERGEALKHFGIEGVIKELGAGKQTIARPNTAAVLSMAKSNNKKVLGIYEGSGYDPVIDVLSRYATGNPDAALPDAFGKGIAEYFKVVEALKEHVPMAIDKLIN